MKIITFDGQSGSGKSTQANLLMSTLPNSILDHIRIDPYWANPRPEKLIQELYFIVEHIRIERLYRSEDSILILDSESIWGPLLHRFRTIPKEANKHFKLYHTTLELCNTLPYMSFYINVSSEIAVKRKYQRDGILKNIEISDNFDSDCSKYLDSAVYLSERVQDYHIIDGNLPELDVHNSIISKLENV